VSQLPTTDGVEDESTTETETDEASAGDPGREPARSIEHLEKVGDIAAA
jgi:hypothetical protein